MTTCVNLGPVECSSEEEKEIDLFREEDCSLGRFDLVYRLYHVRRGMRDLYAMTVAMCDDPIGEYTPMYVLSPSKREACSLFDLLVDGRVTPLHLGDVLEDKLGSFLGDHLLKYREFSLQIPENMIQ